MSTVTSKDGTKIAFDKIGSGPALILVNGAMSYRAFDPTLGQLAEELSKNFTVYNYDRRGRGESTDAGDVSSFKKEREIEDIQALVEDAGGQAMIFGVSSGGALALEAAAATPGITKAAVYEVPFIVDDSRSPVEDYEGHSKKLVQEGKLDELMMQYLPQVFGMLEDNGEQALQEQPADQDASADQGQNTTEEQAQGAQTEGDDQAQDAGMNEDMMKATYAILPTIPYDASFVGEFMKGKPLSSDYWAKVKVPVLVSNGGEAAQWFHNSADALAKVLPQASRHIFEGQSHMFDPKVLAPVLGDFFKK